MLGVVSGYHNKVELSKLAELNASGGGYDWAWQKEAKALQEAAESAAAVGGGAGGVVSEEDQNIASALKLSVDNILMVSGRGFFLFSRPMLCCALCSRYFKPMPRFRL